MYESKKVVVSCFIYAVFFLSAVKFYFLFPLIHKRPNISQINGFDYMTKLLSLLVQVLEMCCRYGVSEIVSKQPNKHTKFV